MLAKWSSTAPTIVHTWQQCRVDACSSSWFAELLKLLRDVCMLSSRLKLKDSEETRLLCSEQAPQVLFCRYLKYNIASLRPCWPVSLYHTYFVAGLGCCGNTETGTLSQHGQSDMVQAKFPQILTCRTKPLAAKLFMIALLSGQISCHSLYMLHAES